MTSAGPLPPGTILQQMYLQERLREWRPGMFLEVGMGRGHTARLLLKAGWRGTGYDLNASAVAAARELNAGALEAGRFAAHQGDWLAEPETAQASIDLLISSMVIEHLDEASERAYFARGLRAVRPGGRAVVLVPSSPRHWGVEDEIAGHLRRYTPERLASVASAAGWRVERLTGLTYPLSNLLLWFSNRLVERAEVTRLELSVAERTAVSGDRDVPGKTTFPSVGRMVLNERVMRPFHHWQHRHASNRDSLVLYGEFTRD